MIAAAFVHPQLATVAPIQHINEDALATAFLPDASACLLPDPALAVLAKTAANWFAPSLANSLHVSAEHGRIRVAGHVGSTRPLTCLKMALLRLRGVGGLDMTVTVEAVTNPARATPLALRHQHIG